MTAVDTYLGDLAARLHVGRRAHERIAAEVRDHLEEATERLVRLGSAPTRPPSRPSPPSARPAPLPRSSTSRPAPGRCAEPLPSPSAAGVAAIAGFLLAATTQPTSAPPTGARWSTCRWRSSLRCWPSRWPSSRGSAPRRGRQPSGAAAGSGRRTGRSCSGPPRSRSRSLAIAAVGWATAVGLSADRLAHPNTATLLRRPGGHGGRPDRRRVCSSCACGSTSPTTRPTTEPVSPGLLGIGERAIDVVRQHPVAACVAVVGPWRRRRRCPTPRRR